MLEEKFSWLEILKVNFRYAFTGEFTMDIRLCIQLLYLLRATPNHRDYDFKLATLAME